MYLPGRSRDEAFDIGEDIANTITQMNPKPIKLKFEKVPSQQSLSDTGVPPMRIARKEAIRWI